MDFSYAARTILSVTARAWAIPLAHDFVSTGICGISYGRFDPGNRRIELED